MIFFKSVEGALMVDSNETLGFQMIFLVGRASGEWSETERIFSPRA